VVFCWIWSFGGCDGLVGFDGVLFSSGIGLCDVDVLFVDNAIIGCIFLIAYYLM